MGGAGRAAQEALAVVAAGVVARTRRGLAVDIDIVIGNLVIAVCMSWLNR